MEQARVAVCHAFGFTYKRQMSHLYPFGIYTIPEVGCVGFSEEAAKAAGRDAVVGRAFYRDNARGKIVGDKDGSSSSSSSGARGSSSAATASASAPRSSCTSARR